MSLFFVLFTYGLWSSVFSLGKMALEYGPPIFLTGSRMILASIVLLSYLLFFKRSSLKITLKQLLSLVCLAVFSIYLTNILEFWSLQHLPAAKTCFLYSLTPFFAAFFSYLHFKEKMNSRKWIGMGIGFLGFIPVMAQQMGSEKELIAFSIVSWPALAMIGATLASVYGWILLRIVVKNDQVSPIMANGTSMLIGGCMALAHSLFVDSWTPLPVTGEHMVPFIKLVSLITLISNIICYNLYGFALKRFTATFLSFIGLLSPIFASLTEWIILGTQPSWLIFLSTGIVTLGLWIVYQAELKQGYILKTPEPTTT